ncbi:MAG TPA: hypothetical protein VF765_29900 [Polyangiaceae bacterium]
MSYARSPSLFATLLLSAACGHYTSFTPTHKPPHPLSARAPETVEFFSVGEPARRYVEVGVLVSGHDSAFSTSSELEVVGALRKQAADIGCDGVLLTDERNHVFVATDQAWTKKDFYAVCIVYAGATAANTGGQ